MQRFAIRLSLIAAALALVLIGAPVLAQGPYPNVVVWGQSSGTLKPVLTGPSGDLFSRPDHPSRIHCVVAVSTATTIQAVGGSCVAPGAGTSIYITDISFGSSAASTVAADSFPTLKSGTGGTCGSSTAVIWQALTAANTTIVENRTIPIKVTANNEVCWIHTVAGSKTIQISGFTAP